MRSPGRVPVVALEPAQPLRPLLVVRLRLGPLGDATHRGHHQRRVVPDRGLGRQHQRVGAVEHGVGDVADLGPGRRRRRHHRLQHLRGRDHRHAELDALPHDRLLQVRHVLERAVDAEVAAGDHDRVGHGEDLGEVRRAPRWSRSWRRAGPDRRRPRAPPSCRRRARTNDTAMNSTPAAATVSASTRSSSVGVASRDRSDGRWTPGQPCARPPFSTTATRRGRRRSAGCGC